MDPTSLEFWDWFYELATRGGEMDPEERLRAAEERWHPDLVLVQSSEMPDTAGEFHGFEGLAASNRELLESWEQIEWRPREVHELGEGRYLVLIEVTGRARRSGIVLEGGEVGHIVTLREGKTERLEAYLGWDNARKAAGLN